MLNPMASNHRYPAMLHDNERAPTLNEQESNHILQAKHRAQMRAVLNGVVTFVLHSPLHPLLSHAVMLITLVGHKSGRILTVPVNYIDAPGGILYTISPRKHVWWHNLEQGDFVRVRVRGHEYKGFGRAIVEPQAAAAALAQALTREPSYARAFRIGWTNDAPDSADLQRAAQEFVVVCIQFPCSKSGDAAQDDTRRQVSN